MRTEVTRTSPAGEHEGAGRGWFGLPPNVFWLSIVSFLNDFSSEMIYPLLPRFFMVTLNWLLAWVEQQALRAEKQ
jgi:hypothetical protein